MTPHTRRQLLEALEAALGADRVEADAAARAKAGRTTGLRGTTPLLVVRPTCTEEVQQVVRLAGEHGASVHPVSCGKNWGYGDACAPEDGQILLDLSGMNQILEVDAELGFAVVEPGVTQGDLADWLEAREVPFTVDCTGAGRDASIVGNAVERGFGHSQNGDRFANALNLEVVLGDGRVVETGLGHFPGAKAANAYRWGLGPSLDGLFSQSNLGIVTRMTIWLVPKSEAQAAFFFTVEEKDAIGAVVDALRPLRLRGTLRTAIHLFNDVRLITGAQGQGPRDDHRRGPLSDEEIRALRDRFGVGAWAGTGALYGAPAEVWAAARELKRALRSVPGMGKILVVDERRLRFLERLTSALNALGLFRSWGPRLERVRLGFELLAGRPTDDSLAGALWHAAGLKRRTPEATRDPLDFRAGLLWLSPLLPARSRDVAAFTACVTPVFARHGFDYQVTFSMVTPRALCAVMTISFDRDDAEELARAEACERELRARVIAEGYIPYRLSNLSMAELGAGSDPFWELCARLKHELDPRHVLSPGHYEPTHFTRHPLAAAV